MVDNTARLFWYRSKEWCQAMADKISDFIYTDESKETLDVINLLLLGWILLGLIVYIIGNVVATYLRKRKCTVPVPKIETTKDITKDIVTSANIVAKTETSSDSLFVVPDESEVPRIPKCDGDNPEISQWINEVFLWIYNQRVVSPIIDSWLSALNARTRLSSTEHGILVDFKDLVSSKSPKVTELEHFGNSRCDINLACDMELENAVFEVTVTQMKEKSKVVVPFVLTVHRLFGKVFIECTPEDLLFLAKYSETPQIQLSAEVSKENEINPEDTQALSDLVCEITTDALSTIKIPFRFFCFPACPRLLLKSASENDLFEAAESELDKRLLVKVIKASNLGGEKGCLKPYCVVEMDEPPQRFETHVVEGTNSPFWDEAFTFTVKDSAELLFEVYDKDKSSGGDFLGLGIVGIEELMRNPSQRQIIPLQSRPLEKDDVSGSLTAEFLFLNQTSPVVETTHLAKHSPKHESLPESDRMVETNSRVTAGGTLITTTTIKRTKGGMY